MNWTKLHSQLLSTAFEEVLGRAGQGAMAYVRCLTPDVVEALAMDTDFKPGDWQVQRVCQWLHGFTGSIEGRRIDCVNAGNHVRVDQLTRQLGNTPSPSLTQ